MNTSLLKTADSEFNEMANESKYFKRPLLKLKYMMEKELKRTNDPDVLAKVILKILKKKKPKILYRKRNSFSLRLISHLPEKWQDDIYKSVIK